MLSGVASRSLNRLTPKTKSVIRRDFFSRQGKDGSKGAGSSKAVDPWLEPLKKFKPFAGASSAPAKRSFADAAASSTSKKSAWLEPVGRTAKNYWKPIVGGLVAGTGLLQVLFGKEDDFYDRRFVLDIDPDALADFYGSENFMDLYSVLPFMGALMMRGGYFDDEGTVHTQGLPFGEMLVSMVFSDSDDDDNAGGGDSKWFNKRERFKNECLGGQFTMWDMITNFGFEVLPDGRVMVYHHGEYFYGYFPPASLVVGLVFRIHSWLVIKTTEHHLRYYAFRNDTDIDEKMEHESRDAMPIFWLMNYNWFKVLNYLLFNKPLDMPDHLKKKRDEAMVQYKLENPDEDEEEEEEEEEAEEETEEAIAVRLERKKTLAAEYLGKRHSLPVQRPDVMRQITIDIAMDKEYAKETLGGAEEADEKVHTKEEEEEEEAIAAMVKSSHKHDNPIAMEEKLKKRMTRLRRIKTSQAVQKFKTSLDKEKEDHPEDVAAVEGDSASSKLKRYATRIKDDLSNAVSLSSSATVVTGGDDKDASAGEQQQEIDNFRAVGMTARAKLVQRRATKARMKRRGTSLIGVDKLKLEEAIALELKNPQ